MWKVLIPMVLMKQKPNDFFSVNALLENSQNSSSGKANKIIEHGFMSIFRLTMEKIKDWARSILMQGKFAYKKTWIFYKLSNIHYH